MSSRSSATAHDAPLPDEEASLTGGRPLSDAACHTGAGAFAVPASPSLLSPPRGPAGWGRGRSGLYAFPWTRLREAFYATVIAVLCVLVLVLAIARTGSRQLAPYCLFAVGGGYMEGTAFPQEDRLASSDCNAAIKAYLTEGQYETDVETVAQDALDVLRGLSAPNATYVLVFDIDETVLSNMAEFEHMRYGKKPYDGAWEHAWQLNATAPALEPMLRLYERAFDMGLSVTFITGRAEWSRNATQFNLKHSGFGEQCAPEQCAPPAVLRHMRCSRWPPPPAVLMCLSAA